LRKKLKTVEVVNLAYSDFKSKLVKKLFKDFYAKNAWKIRPPTSIEKREFAFILIEGGEMVRHKGFSSLNGLIDYIKSEIPLHVYYSSAYYANPAAKEMELKEWLGADLVFDIDADHIPTRCKEEHDAWRCNNCGAQDRGLLPASCPRCGSKHVTASSSWLCYQCLEAAKDEAIKLIEDFLIPDFGFSTSEISISFSGRRGYHIHIESPKILSLDPYARREIVDYIKATELIPDAQGFEPGLKVPTIGDYGWRGKLAKGLYLYLSQASVSELSDVAGPDITGGGLETWRNNLLKNLEGGSGPWLLPSSSEAAKKLFERAVAYQRCNIDERVTTDVKRLIRLPGSLHGGTGLQVLSLSLNDLERFNPLKSAVAFRTGHLKCFVKHAPQIAMMDQTFGPYHEARVELPLAVALYLLLQGLAEAVGDNS